jgi:hypothetical protein
LKRGYSLLLSVTLIILAWLQPLHSQEDDCGDECKLNSNVAIIVSVPLKTTAQVTSTGWGTVGGVGWNINKRNALIGEFLWNRLYSDSATLQTLQPTGNLNGSVDLYSVTGNYRFELRGRLLGAYVIGGGGWYMRNTNLSQSVTVGAGTVCTPAWLWWGFTCTSGTVNVSQTLASSSSNALGGNAGGGFTIRVGPAPYRLYAEARYHFAPTKNISTQLVAVTFGIRY